MNNSQLVMRESGKLVKACLENRDIDKTLIEKENLIQIAFSGNMQYMLLYPLLKKEKDGDLKNKVKIIIKQSTFSTYVQTMSARQITTLFEKENVRHQLLKGAVIKDIYPSPVMRQMSDIDIVVFDETLDRAAKLLEKEGYVNHGLIKHHMIFTSPTGVHVELHWCLYDQNVDYGQYIYFKDTFRSKLVNGLKSTYEFNIEDFYIYMIAHMAKHFFETGCGIRNLVDIYVYTKYYDGKMDAAYVGNELRKCGLYDFEKNMKNLSYIWLDQEECSQFYENLFSYMVECGIYGKRINGVWGQLAKETNGKRTTKLRYYFPSITFMKEKYPWLEKREFLLPLAWFLRGTKGAMSSQGSEHAGLITRSGDAEIDKMLEIYCRMNLDFRKNSKED